MRKLRIGILGAARITEPALIDPARETGDALVAVAARSRDRARAGVVVIEAFHYLHHPVMRRMLQLVADGELGELRTVEAHVSMPAPPDTDPRWSLELAGGAVMDLGCYGLHALRMLAPFAGGAPAVGSARAAERPGHPGVDEWLTAELDYPGGTRGLLHCSMNDDRRVTLRVVGEHGEACAANFVLPHRDDRIEIRTRTGVRTEQLGRRSSYIYQLEALRAHLLDTAPFPLDTADAVANAELVDAVYLAAGLPVRPATHIPEVTG